MKRLYARATINLESLAITTRNKLAVLGTASGKDWSRLKAETDQAMADLSQACLKAEKRPE
jgi:hypothetical protein